MRERLKKIAFRDNRVDMIGLILFGPEKARSFLRLRYDMLPEPEPVDVLDYLQCIRSIDHLFIKHCGPPFYMGLRQSHSLSNLCSLAKKKAIEDAIIQSCGLNIIEPVLQEQVPYRYPAFGTGLPFITLFASKWVPVSLSIRI
ncbi:putative legumain protein [Helianthus anomalus]